MLTCHSRQRFINGACIPLTEVLLFAHCFNIMANWDTLNSCTIISSTCKFLTVTKMSIRLEAAAGRKNREERGTLASVLIQLWLVRSMSILNFSADIPRNPTADTVRMETHDPDSAMRTSRAAVISPAVCV